MRLQLSNHLLISTAIHFRLELSHKTPRQDRVMKALAGACKQHDEQVQLASYWYLGGERASPPKFSEVTINGYLPNSSTWLQGVCESHGAVFVQFVGGSPPLLTDGTILNIWNFVNSSTGTRSLWWILLGMQGGWSVSRLVVLLLPVLLNFAVVWVDGLVAWMSWTNPWKMSVIPSWLISMKV